MKKTIACILLFFIAKSAVAQQANFEWARSLSNSINKSARTIFTDATGNVYTIGQFSGTIDFDPGPATFNLTAQGTAVYIIKLDSSGNFIWARQVGGIGSVDCAAAYLDEAAGVLYCTGAFQGNIDFDPGPSSFNLASTTYGVTYILKLHISGTFIWAKQVASSNAQSNAGSSVKGDNNGNIYITGNFSGIADFDPGNASYELTATNSLRDMYILKMDAAGNFLWTKQLSGLNTLSNQTPASLSLDNAGNIYTAGYFDSTVDFDPGAGVYTLTSKGDWDAFVLKLDANGAFVWVKAMGGSGQNGIVSVTATDDGYVYTAGYISGAADFDPGAGVYTLTSAGNSDCFIAKLDNNGNFIWATVFGSTSDDGIWNMALDNTQNIYCTGYFKNTVDFDPGPATLNLSSTGTYNSFILKLNAVGGLVWVKQLAASIIFGTAITTDAQKNVFTAGNFTGQCDFDPGTGVYNLSSAAPAEYDVFIQKMRQSCTAATYDTLNVSTCKKYTINNSTYTESGTYRQLLSNMAGCDSNVILHLSINRLHTAINAEVCAADGYFTQGAYQHTAGVYTDTLQSAGGCDSVVIINLRIKPSPAPDCGTDRDICPGEILTISPGTFNSYLWNDNSTTVSKTINAPGTYWVRVTGRNNCTATDTFRILSVRNNPADFLPEDRGICNNSIVNLFVPGFKTYLWSNGSNSRDISIRSIGTYYLTVKDFYNCTGTDTIHITRAGCVPFGIPNAFSPNNDSHNDFFKPVINLLVQQYHFTIYNRLGQKIFETTDPANGWDGTFNSNPQDAGVYIYTLSFTDSDGKFYNKNDTVVLIR